MKRVTKFLLFIFIIFLSSKVIAQSKKHPVDIEYEKCLNTKEGQTTAGMIGCAQKAYDSWNIELNKYYKLLIDKLNADEKTKLIKSQKSWIYYRDNEADFFGKVCVNLEGTMYRQMAVDRKVEIIKQRTLDLKSYYELLIAAK